MRPLVPAACLSVLTLLVPIAVAATPPPPAPVLQVQGRDQVLIGRIYWRHAGQTQPLARFGVVLADKATTQAVAYDGVAAGAGHGTLSLTARRKGSSETAVEWALQPGGGSSVAAARGNATAREGSVGHVPLGVAGDGELFASLETGRASSFNMQRLWDHFGVVTDSQRFVRRGADEEPAWTPAPGGQEARGVAPAPPAPAPPRGGTMVVSCASGTRYELSTGSGTGRCAVEVEGDRVTGGACDDGDGNAASASCALNGGTGSCLAASGSGACRSLR